MNPVVVCNIPHSSIVIPKDVRPSILLSDEDLQIELLRMTDWFTDEIFHFGDKRFNSVRYPISRLVLDPERFLEDHREIMSARGMGVIYTKTSQGKQLRQPPDPSERTSLIEKYYIPHHCALSGTVAEILSNSKNALLIDCHSFASWPLPHEIHQDPVRPDICLGTDDYHTPSWLTDLAQRLFLQAGFSVEINRPFAGVLVPSEYFAREPAVCAIMIELNRSLYMNEETGTRNLAFERVGEKVRSIVLNLVDDFLKYDLDK